MNGPTTVTTVPRTRLTTARWLGLAFASSSIVALAIVATGPSRGDGVSALVVPGEKGPSVAVFHDDFPRAVLAPDAGHDGQQFYAISRQPMHPKAVAPDLDRPRYRLQRILMPVLAWAVQPQGGGGGLVIANFLIAAFGALAVGFGGAWLLDALGAPERVTARAALLLPVLPGVIASVGLSIPDALALGLGLIALALDARGRLRSAVAVGILAVLARETILLLFLGWVVWRGRRSIWLLVVPTVVAAAWWLTLRLTVPATGYTVQEFEPIGGLVRSVRLWAGGEDLAAAVAVIASFALGIVALRRGGLRAPLSAAIVMQLAFVVSLGPNVIGVSWNATRATLPLMVLAVLALLARTSTRVDPAERARPARSAV